MSRISKNYLMLKNFIEEERKSGYSIAAREHPTTKVMLDEDNFLFKRYQMMKSDIEQVYDCSIDTFIDKIKSNSAIHKITLYVYNFCTNEFELRLLSGIEQRWFMFTSTRKETSNWIKEFKALPNAERPIVLTPETLENVYSFRKREKIIGAIRFFISDPTRTDIPFAIVFLNSTSQQSFSHGETHRLTQLIKKFTPSILSLRWTSPELIGETGVETRRTQYDDTTKREISSLDFTYDNMQSESNDRLTLLHNATGIFSEIRSQRDFLKAQETLSAYLTTYFLKKGTDISLKVYRYIDYANLLENILDGDSNHNEKFVALKENSLEALILKANKTIFLENVDHLKHFYKKSDGISVHKTISSVIAVPFLIDQTPFMLLLESNKINAFEKTDASLLVDLMDIVSGSVEKYRQTIYARQLQEFRIRTKQLIEGDRTSPTDLKSLLDQLCAFILGYTGSHRVNISLCENRIFPQSEDDIGSCTISPIEDWIPRSDGHSSLILTNRNGIIVQYEWDWAREPKLNGCKRWILNLDTKEFKSYCGQSPRIGSHAKSRGIVSQIGIPLHCETPLGVLWISYVGEKHYLNSKEIEDYRQTSKYIPTKINNEYLSNADIGGLKIFSDIASITIQKLMKERLELRKQFPPQGVKFLLDHPEYKEIKLYKSAATLCANIEPLPSQDLLVFSLNNSIPKYLDFLDSFFYVMKKYTFDFSGAINRFWGTAFNAVWVFPIGCSEDKIDLFYKNGKKEQLFPAIECSLRMFEEYENGRIKFLKEFQKLDLNSSVLKLSITIGFDGSWSTFAGFSDSRQSMSFTTHGHLISNVLDLCGFPSIKDGVFINRKLRNLYSDVFEYEEFFTESSENLSVEVDKILSKKDLT